MGDNHPGNATEDLGQDVKTGIFHRDLFPDRECQRNRRIDVRTGNRAEIQNQYDEDRPGRYGIAKQGDGDVPVS